MPKTLRNEYNKKLSYENLMKAHIKSKKGKGYRIENINCYLKQEEYIMYLYNQLKNMTYKHGGYTVFYVTEPKVRKIEKSRYIDRIVHRWLVDNFLEPTFVPTFINSSFACLKNRGMHRAALYVQACMRKAKNKWDNYYILKMDIAKYFDNINKKILLNIIERKIKDKKVLWLIKEILYSQSREKGLEIGNYTSQMFGNIYLNELDQFIKHKLHIKYYARYLDDSIVIVETKQEAKNALEQITRFLKENLQLKLNKKTQIFKGKMTSKQAKKYLAGHLGYIKYADANNLLNKVFYKDN